MDFLIALQGWIYKSLAALVSAFAAAPDWTALAVVLPAGVAFGAIHALTPGHSKTVLASYLSGRNLRSSGGSLWPVLSPSRMYFRLW